MALSDFIKVKKVDIEKSMSELGTTVKILVILNQAPTTITVTVKDVSNVTVVDAAAMVQETTTIFSYLYQSGTADSNGIYKIVVDAVLDSYTTREIREFTLTDTDE